MNNVKSKVALVRCFSYQQEEVEQALAKGLALLGGFSNIFSAKPLALDSRLILKPNLLAKTDTPSGVSRRGESFAGSWIYQLKIWRLSGKSYDQSGKSRRRMRHQTGC